MGVELMEKPAFTNDQMISASNASKNFGQLRKKAKECPMVITDNGVFDTVVMGYEYFEQIYQRLRELEEEEEARTLLTRIEDLDKDPSKAIPWRSVRRTEQING